jgi:glycosyltransferase involved in cell wall biosynthesis
MTGRVFGTPGVRPTAPAAPPRPENPSAKAPYIDAEIGWFLPAIREGQRLISRQRPDVIFSSAPPFTCHLVAGWLAWRHGIRWVADFRDPWARSPWKRADLTDPWKIRLREWLERKVVEHADAVILNTPLLWDEFAAYYGSRLAAKFHTVTNGYDAEQLAPYLVPSDRPGRSRLVLTHAGSLYRQRDPKPLVRALASAIEKGRISADGIELNFVGSVSPEFRLPEAIADLGLASVVRLTPPVTHERAMQHLVRSDALIVIQPGTRLQVPLKLYEYLPFLKPILALAPAGALTAIAEGSGLGLVAAPDDSRAIEDAICQLYEHRHRLAERFRPDPAYIAQFESGVVSRQMQRILETV